MKNIFLICVAALFLAACNLSDSVNFSGDLAMGELVSGTLEVETPDTFFFDFGADTYIYGVCDQLTVDVKVALYDTAGTSLGRFDGPGEGPENFMFEISEAGRYMLEIAPFEEETGDYTLELKVVEALASNPAKRADQLMYAYAGDEVPGGVVGVIENGELVFSKAYGMANLGHGIPYAVGTPSNIGSVSKQFTAMAILLLEQQGKLSLEDDVRKHIPELPDLGQVVKIKNMLNHTNGFREVYNLMPLTGWKGEDVLLRGEVLEMLKRQEELQADPGEEYNYNNSAFIMLAEIVERISEQSFPEFMEENVFGPLGMTSSVVRADPATIIPLASQGYVLDSTGYKEAGDLYAAYGAGGIYTTVADFARWMGNFNDPVVGDSELITRLVTVDTLNSGDTLSYALGIGVNDFRGLQSYGHGGADIAHRAYAVYFPEINAGVIAMSNNANFPSGDIAHKLARSFFEDSLEPEEAEEGESAEAEEEAEDAEELDATEDAKAAEESAVVEVPLDMLEAYAGRYILEGMGMVVEYSVENGVLKMNVEGQPEATLKPLSRVKFSYEEVEATVEFKWSEEGEVSGAVHWQGGQDYELKVLPPYEASLEELQAYEGRYFSKELDVFYKLELQDSTLLLLIRNSKEVKLSVIKEDVFKGDIFFIGEVAFEKDAKGEVSGFAVSSGRTKGIRFERL